MNVFMCVFHLCKGRYLNVKKTIKGLLWVVFTFFCCLVFYLKNELYNEGKIYLTIYLQWYHHTNQSRVPRSPTPLLPHSLSGQGTLDIIVQPLECYVIKPSQNSATLLWKRCPSLLHVWVADVLASTLWWWSCRHSLRPWLKRPLSEQSLETGLAQ